jgi:hypothetical protein
MTPQEMEKRILALEAELRAFQSAGDLDHTKVRGIQEAVLPFSDSASSAHNETVDEAGSSTLLVMDNPQGFFKVQGKDVPYFD